MSFHLNNIILYTIYIYIYIYIYMGLAEVMHLEKFLL